MMALSNFDPEFASPAEWARMYRAQGLQVVPAPFPMRSKNDKRPDLPGWTEFRNELVSDTVFERWFPLTPAKRTNFGVIAGAASGRLLVVDIDDYAGGQGAEWWRSVTGDIEPETWVQTTGGGGRQYFFTLPPGVTISTHRTPIADIRCQGGFAMVPPSLHMSGKEYEWNKYRAPWEIEIAEASPALIQAVVELIESHRGTFGGAAEERTDNPATDFDSFGGRINGREWFMHRLVWAAVLNLYREQAGIAPDEDVAKEAHDDALNTYLRACRTRIPGVGNLEGLEREGRGPTAFMAKWQGEMRKWHGKVASEAAKPSPRPFEGEANTATAANAVNAAPEPVLPPEGIHATPFAYINPTSIPPRAWVYGRHYIRKFVSTTVAPGGVGKTSLGDVEALAIVTGRPLLGIAPDERCNVWKWNGEDPLEELQRRLMAAICHYGIPREEVEGRLFVDTGRETPIVIASKTRDGAVINAPVIDQVIATIKANRIGVFTVDPFVSCHRVSENDNSEIERVAKAWAQIADVTGCAIELVHHVRKTNGMEVSVEDGRGAVALLSAARSARALNRMTADEAARIGVKDPGFYFRTDNGKSNLAPPSEGAQWYRMVSFDLDNDTPMSADAPARPSDKVGVVTPWEWPDMTSGVTTGDLHAVRSAVGAGRFRADPQSGQWVGYAIMEAVGIEPDDAGKAKAKALQRMWTESRALEEYDDKDEARRIKKFVRPGPFND